MIQTTWAMPVFETKAMPRRWFTKPQKDTLRKIYPTAPREAILAEFPHHSWPAIMERARRMKIRRRSLKNARD